MRLAQRWAISFVVLGMIYLGMEVFARAARGELVGYRDLAWQSLAGWSSVWMFPIGGLCGVIIGALNEYHPLMRLWLQCLIGTGAIFIIELLAGLVLNIWLGLGLWDYSSWPCNILGQVTLCYLPIWYLVCPAAIWLDDVLRIGIGQLGPQDSLFDTYKDLFAGK